MIKVAHLRKIYREIAAVDDATFAANTGEIFGLLGPNGAGKTTTIGCISGLFDSNRETERHIIVGTKKRIWIYEHMLQTAAINTGVERNHEIPP
jgi:ABC-type multidrug transport system ATPase subunit